MDNQGAPIFPSGFGEGGGLTEVNRVNAEKPKTLRTSLLAIRGRAVDLVTLATFDKPELGRKEDLIALSRPFKPFSQELLVIAIETLLVWLAKYVLFTIPNRHYPTKTYSELSQNVAPSSRARSRIANRSSSPGIDP